MGHDRKTYLTERLSELEKTSEFLKRTGNIRKKISTLTTGSRVLTKREIEILEKQGNRSVDWSLIRVDPGFIPDNILSNRFTGGCFLGIFPDPETGICGSCISDSFVLDGATVDMGSRLEKTIVCEDAQVSASTITGTGSSVFGNGSVVSPGLESGGRDFRLFAELDMVLAEELVISGRDEFRERYDAFIGDYLKKVSLPFSVIDLAAVVHRLGSGTNVYIGPGARVENCQHMTDTTIVSSAEEPAVVSGAVEIASSVLQWGCVVDSGAMVGNSVLLEYSHAGSHAKISGSIIGHDTSIERGEVWASLVGPCVGFHHHSLLISAFWPRGKGNIGYGAMVGSNHTSRAQDQEIRPGEGMFFGLGSCIKFPANYSASPYSVIPSGLVVPSQKVEFPFSLLNQPRDDHRSFSGGLNRLLPGWCLYANLYMCVRASYKYGDRIKARRHSVPADVFREEIMMLVDTALGRLVQSAEQLKKRVSVDSDHSVLFPDELEGLGKNYLTLDDAEKGIDGYRFILRFYALREYFSDAGPGSGTVRSDRAGVYSGKLMERFGLAERPAAELAAVYREILDRFLFLTESSKEKDMIRGEKIIPDYRQTHHAASEDPVITRLKEWIFSEKDKVSSL